MNKIDATTDKPQTAREIKAAWAAEKATLDVAAARKADRRSRQLGALQRWGRSGRGLLIAVFLLAIALIALWASFQHLRHLAILGGQDATHWYSTANAIPVAIDLMMFIASLQLRKGGLTEIAVIIARTCMLGGLLVSLGGNVLEGYLVAPADLSSFDLGWRLFLSAVPVLALLGSVEMLTHTHKDRKVIKRRGSKNAASAPARSRSASTQAAPVTA